jgi:hypothetical protein
MDNIIENDKNFKQAIGEFIIAFSQLEYGLVFLYIMTEFDLRKRNESLNKYLSIPFDKKLKHLDEYIKENLIEISLIWEKLHIEIKKLNNERRFLVHGFISNSLPKDNISRSVKVNGRLVSKNQSLCEIKLLIDYII